MKTTNNQLTFQPGKFYKTRDGKKARIYATDGSKSFPIHGSLYIDGEWRADVWTASGGELMAEPSDRDLIAEWKDAPEVDWSQMPAWVDAVTWDRRGWIGWMKSPSPEETMSIWFIANGDPHSVIIPPAYCPKWSGDWRDSLVTRPTEGAQP